MVCGDVIVIYNVLFVLWQYILREEDMSRSSLFQRSLMLFTRILSLLGKYVRLYQAERQANKYLKMQLFEAATEIEAWKTMWDFSKDGKWGLVCICHMCNFYSIVIMFFIIIFVVFYCYCMCLYIYSANYCMYLVMTSLNLAFWICHIITVLYENVIHPFKIVVYWTLISIYFK